MKRYALQFIALTMALAAGNAFALDTAALLEGQASASLLEKNCIQTDISGLLPIRFDSIAWLLGQPDLIQRIQTEYRRSVYKDGGSNFTIIGTGSGAYHYVNEKNQRTDILELYRKQTSDTTFDLIYHARGKRYFGKYDVLILVRIIDASTMGVVYTASIYAYPRNSALRFFARRMGSIERYFRNKTELINRISIEISNGLQESTPFVLPVEKPAPGFMRIEDPLLHDPGIDARLNIR